MFTGIIEEIGTICSIQKGSISARISITCDTVLKGTKIGDSIAVNGICLTVAALSPNCFTADVMAETIRRSALSTARVYEKVNLERAMAADGRFGGHLVSGHIDGTGRIAGIRREENAVWYTIEAGPELLYYIVEKGSVALDGISLTVADVWDSAFQVSVIPHTGQVTVLCKKQEGSLVNLECDMVGKYIHKFLCSKEPEAGTPGSRINTAFLAEHGFY